MSDSRNTGKRQKRLGRLSGLVYCGTGSQRFARRVANRGTRREGKSAVRREQLNYA